MVTEESGTGSAEVALYEKIEAVELPEDKDRRDWTAVDWLLRHKKMVEEEMAEEDGWAALPFAPELQSISCGVFLVSSVEYSWPGYFPGDEDKEEELWEEFVKVSKVVKIVREGNEWRLWEFLVEEAEDLLWFGGELLAGEGEGDLVVKENDHMVRSQLNSMRILATGELLLIRKSLVPGLEFGGPDFRGVSYTFYSPI